MSDAGTSSADPTPPSEAGGTSRTRDRRGWFAPAFWLLVCAALVTFGLRSRHHTDVLVLYSRAGQVQGLASHGGRVLLAFSSLSLGPEKSLSAEAVSVPREEGDRLYDLVYGSWPRLRDRGRFGVLTTHRGELVGDATHVVLSAPHWFLATLAGLPVVARIAGALRRVRRRRKGWCVGCGYDLRGGAGGVGGICPECGRPVGEPRSRTGAAAEAA